MPHSSAPPLDTPRPGTAYELADAGLCVQEWEGALWVVQDVGADPVPDVAMLLSHPGAPLGLMVRDTAGAAALVHPLGDARWLAGLLDARARHPVMPPRAVLEAGVMVADALEAAWGTGATPPVVRPDVRAVSLRIAPDGTTTYSAFRFAGRPPRDAGDGRGPVSHDDTRGEDLYLLGSVLYEMATRRRFGRAALTETVHRHHVQRRMTAADFSDFGPVRGGFTDLVLSLVAWNRDSATPFGSAALACRELLARIEGDGIVEWARAVFTEGATRAAPDDAVADAPEPRVATHHAQAIPTATVARSGVAIQVEEATPLAGDRLDEPTDLPPEGAPPVVRDEQTEVSHVVGPEITPPVAVAFARPQPLVLPPPSIGPATDPPAEEEANVVPLHPADARPGTRRGGLVQRPIPDGSVAAAVRPRPPEPEVVPPAAPRRARGVAVGVVAVVFGFSLAVAGGLWIGSRPTGPDAARADPVEVTAVPSGSDAPLVAPSAAPPVPEPPVVVVPAPVPATAVVVGTPPPSASPPAVAVERVASPSPAPLPPVVPSATSDASPWASPVVPQPDASPWSGATTSAQAPVRVSLNSKPQGALVTVDGHPRGTTPLQVFLAPGSHTLSFDLDGRVVAREVPVDPTSKNAWTYLVGQARIE